MKSRPGNQGSNKNPTKLKGIYCKLENFAILPSSSNEPVVFTHVLSFSADRKRIIQYKQFIFNKKLKESS